MPVLSERELKYVIRMNDQTAREREAINRGLGGIGKTAESVTGKLESMAQAIVASGAFKAIIGFAKGAVTAFADAEASAQRLSMALEMRGMQSAEKGLSDLADATQRLAGVDGDLVKQLMAELVAQGKTEAQTRKMIQAATALSTFNKEDLSVSVEKLNGTLAGQARELGKSNLAIRELTEEQLKAGAAIDIVIDQYGKFVGKTGETQIALNVAKESVGDMVEAIGSTLAPVVKGGAAVIGALADAFSNAHPIVKGIVGIIVGAMIGAFAAMTVKTLALTAAKWGLFTSEMAVNAAMAVTNPLIWAGIAAVGVAIGVAASMATARQKEANATDEATRATSRYIAQARTAAELVSSATNPFGSRTVGSFNPVGMQNMDELKRYLEALKAARMLNQSAPTPMRQSGFGGPLVEDTEAANRLAAELANIDAEMATAQSRMTELYTSGIENLKGIVSGSSSEIENLRRQLAEVKATAAGPQDQGLKTQAIKIIESKIAEILQKDAEAAAASAADQAKYLAGLKQNLVRQSGDRLAILDMERQQALEEMRSRLKDTTAIEQATTDIEAFYANERVKIAEEGAKKAIEASPTFVGEMGRATQEGGLFKELELLASGDIWGALGAIIGEALSGITELADVLNPITTMVKEMLSILAPVLGEILAPVAGILKVVGITLAKILVPVLQLLVPVIDLLAQAFIWIYNQVIMPIANGLILLFNKVYNFFVDMINQILKLIDDALLGDQSYRVKRRKLDSVTLTAIDTSTLYNTGSSTATSTTTSGSSASYAAGTSITIESIEIKADFIAGEAGMTDVALKIRDLILEAERVGR